MANKRHKHDIEYYRKLRNEGLSWREIGRYAAINHNTIIEWVKRNYTEITVFEYIRK